MRVIHQRAVLSCLHGVLHVVCTRAQRRGTKSLQPFTSTQRSDCAGNESTTVQLKVAGRGGGIAGSATMLVSTKYHGQQLAPGLVQVVAISVTNKALARQIVVQADDRNAEPPLVAGSTTLADVPPSCVAVISDGHVMAQQQAPPDTTKGGSRAVGG